MAIHMTAIIRAFLLETKPEKMAKYINNFVSHDACNPIQNNQKCHYNTKEIRTNNKQNPQKTIINILVKRTILIFFFFSSADILLPNHVMAISFLDFV